MSTPTATLSPVLTVDPVAFGYQRLYERGRLGPVKLRIDVAQIQRMTKGEQVETLAMLRELEQLKIANPLEFYEPASIKHVAVHASAKKIRGVFGGNRAGKSTIGQVDTVIQAAPIELVPRHCRWIKRWDCETQGPFLARTVVNDMQKTGQVVRDKWKEWIPKALLRQGSFDRAYDKMTNQLKLECGCMFELLSTEQDLDKHGGHARHRVLYDEEPPQTYRTENVQRLADYGGDELFAMTPLKGLSWTYHDIWKKRGSEYVDAWTIGMRDNRNLSEDNIRFVLSQITNDAERRQREYGVFAERGGAVYPNFMDRRIPAPSAAVVQNLRTVVGIDPGIRFCGLVFAGFDPDGRLLVWAASLLKNQDAAQYAIEIRRTLKAWGLDEKDVEYVIDPSARNRSMTNAESVEGVLQRQGIFTDPGQNDVDAGIQDISTRLKQGGIYISDQLHGLFDEAIEYSWEEREDGRAVPSKKNDHRLDALRYIAMSDPWEPVDESSRLWIPAGADVARPPAAKEPAGSVLGAEV